MKELEEERERRWKSEQASMKLVDHIKKLQVKGKMSQLKYVFVLSILYVPFCLIYSSSTISALIHPWRFKIFAVEGNCRIVKDCFTSIHPSYDQIRYVP